MLIQTSNSKTSAPGGLTPDHHPRVDELWEGSVTKGSGFVALPMALLRLQSKLGISPTEFGVLANLIAHRWKPDDVVFPRTTVIAKRMGVTPRTVQRATDRLSKAGYIKKSKTADGMRAYDITPLVKKLDLLFPQSLEIREVEKLGA